MHDMFIYRLARMPNLFVVYLCWYISKIKTVLFGHSSVEVTQFFFIVLWKQIAHISHDMVSILCFFCDRCNMWLWLWLWRWVKWMKQHIHTKKNVSSRRTLPTGYLTKLMDTYEARSIAHVLFCCGASPLLFATKFRLQFLLLILIT